MRWSLRPKFKIDYDQSKHIDVGVCYGMCRRILELDGHATNARTLEKAFEILRNRIHSRTFLLKGLTAQVNRRQTGRNYVSYPLSQQRFYIVSCNISLSAGYCTPYSLASYVTPSGWSPDHAVLLLGVDGGTLMFDPNWGCAAWESLPIEILRRKQLEELIGGGYKPSFPVYVTHVET